MSATIPCTIHGVDIKPLISHHDRRGFFRELARNDDPFFQEGIAQWSQSLMFDQVVKAWHYHHIQTDWFYVPMGIIRVGLADMRKDSPTYKKTMDFLMGDHQTPMIVKIPPGVAHGAATVQGPALLFYMTSQVYNPADEIRIPYDTPEINFDWLARAPIT
jgi:dTDP-4-dehydrorhamnose 3,5-epimerase